MHDREIVNLLNDLGLIERGSEREPTRANDKCDKKTAPSALGMIRERTVFVDEPPRTFIKGFGKIMISWKELALKGKLFFVIHPPSSIFFKMFDNFVLECGYPITRQPGESGCVF